MIPSDGTVFLFSKLESISLSLLSKSLTRTEERNGMEEGRKEWVGDGRKGSEKERRKETNEPRSDETE